MFVCDYLFFNKFIRNISYINVIQNILVNICQISACSQLFLIVDLRYVLTRFKAEKMPSPSAFVACECRSNPTIVFTSLIKKRLFRDVSSNFLTMVLISIVSLSSLFCHYQKYYLAID